MSPYSGYYDNRPFEDYKKVFKKLKKKKLYSYNKLNSFSDLSQKSDLCDDELFNLEMADVKPLKGCNKISAKPPNIDVSLLGTKCIGKEDESVKNDLLSLIECGKGFDVSKTPEYQELIGAGVPKGIAQKLHNGKFSVQEFIDLHGFCAKEAEEMIQDFLRKNFKLRKNAVLIVHGRGLSSPGEPVLKKKVKEILSSNYWRRRIYAYTSAKRTDGGSGGTYVLFRDKPLTGKQEKKLFKKRNLKSL